MGHRWLATYNDSLNYSVNQSSVSKVLGKLKPSPEWSDKSSKWGHVKNIEMPPLFTGLTHITPRFPKTVRLISKVRNLQLASCQWDHCPCGGYTDRNVCIICTLPKVQSSQHRFLCWKGCLKIIGWFNIQGPDVKSMLVHLAVNAKVP